MVWPIGSAPPNNWFDTVCPRITTRDALITSANFTDRGQTRNLELGVLIRDRAFAEILVAQWGGLVAQGIVRRYEG